MARWSQLYKQKKPVLFYWYDPQYLNAQYEVGGASCRSAAKGCQDDEKQGGDAKQTPARTAYGLDKLVWKEFVVERLAGVGSSSRPGSGHRPTRTSVANLIAGKKMKPEKAAEQWVKANAAKVNAWLQ